MIDREVGWYVRGVSEALECPLSNSGLKSRRHFQLTVRNIAAAAAKKTLRTRSAVSDDFLSSPVDRTETAEDITETRSNGNQRNG